MKKIKKRYLILGITVVVLFILSIPQIIHKNKGETISTGPVWDGSLENAYLLPYRGRNFSYFSPFSYYILNNAYTHHDVYHTILDAYQICETTCPDTYFRLMETSNIDGGRVHFHRTHQNGYSADFMVPKINAAGEQTALLDYMGMSHYLLKFGDDGSNSMLGSVKIDFEAMGKHILALHEASSKNGLRIKKIILKINLKDDLYKTPSGKEIQNRGIYIVQRLRPIVDKLHDDHYHVDFERR